MSEPESFTAQQAADPATPGQTLADIAALRPDLRPVVAANPAAYPGLLEWLGSLGEPAVDAALAARASAPADALGTAVLPTAQAQPWQQAPGQYPAPGAQPGQGPDAGAQPGQYAAPGSHSGYPAPGAQPGQYPAPGYGAPQGQYPAPGGQPGQYPAPGAQPYGAQPYAGTPPRSGGGKKVLWIVLGIVGFLVIAGGLGVFFLVRAGLDAVNDLPTSIMTDLTDNAELESLKAECAAEDWAACDELYMRSPGGSDYETFGDTCGGRTEGGSYCVDEFGDGSSDSSGSTDTSSDANAYGDDAALDALWDQCAAGDGQACDDLYFQAPIGSEYEAFGNTCGNTQPEGTLCSTLGTEG
ncbi:MAG: hypothetical protein HGA44_03700 [Cellulomonadaceae bacterium]|nr:hypothetical protein [Cellulomonadaceae bacterium]